MRDRVCCPLGLLMVVLLTSTTPWVQAGQSEKERPKISPTVQKIIERAPVQPTEAQWPGEATSFDVILHHVGSDKYSLSIGFEGGERAFLRDAKPETIAAVQRAFANPKQMGVLAYYKSADNTIDFLMVFSRK